MQPAPGTTSGEVPAAATLQCTVGYGSGAWQLRTVDSVLKYTKKSWGRDPRTPAAEGDTYVRTHPHAHLPDAGAPPRSLGWLLACRQVNSALLFKLVLFSQCRFSTVVCRRCAPRSLGGAQCKFGGHAKKFLPALRTGLSAPAQT